MLRRGRVGSTTIRRWNVRSARWILSAEAISRRVAAGAAAGRRGLRRRHKARGGIVPVRSDPPPARKSLSHLASSVDTGRAAAGAARRLAHVRLARGADRLDRHLPARPLGLADAARRRRARLSLWRGDRHVERQLDYLLGL